MNGQYPEFDNEPQRELPWYTRLKNKFESFFEPSDEHSPRRSVGAWFRDKKAQLDNWFEENAERKRRAQWEKEDAYHRRNIRQEQPPAWNEPREDQGEVRRRQDRGAQYSGLEQMGDTRRTQPPFRSEPPRQSEPRQAPDQTTSSRGGNDEGSRENHEFAEPQPRERQTRSPLPMRRRPVPREEYEYDRPPQPRRSSAISRTVTRKSINFTKNAVVIIGMVWGIYERENVLEFAENAAINSVKYSARILNWEGKTGAQKKPFWHEVRVGLCQDMGWCHFPAKMEEPKKMPEAEQKEETPQKKKKGGKKSAMDRTAGVLLGDAGVRQMALVIDRDQARLYPFSR